ncbi:MAG: 4-hydroxy-tetrahydrodipicolinate synthase [Planctomycetes bacterium]|nr:4-hydroxy-tetrahydrodipicolinate synthase [Planctomycetota bacterium]
MEFRGNIVALVTPLRNGSVDAPALQRLIDRVIAGGVAAVVPCGTTGESPTLSHDEHDEVVALTVQAVRGRVPVIAGTGSNSTAEAIRLTRAAARAGAKAALSVNPYYNRPSQAGLVRHFLTIAEASEIPIVLYNIPGRCAVELTLETIVELARHPNVRAIKEATGNVENVTRIRAATPLAVLSGDDSLTLPMMALGACGVVSVLANLAPAAMTRLVGHIVHGELPAARELHDRLHPVMKALFVETNPVPIKTALAHLGLMAEEFRLPLCALREENRRILLAALDAARGELH